MVKSMAYQRNQESSGFPFCALYCKGSISTPCRTRLVAVTGRKNLSQEAVSYIVLVTDVGLPPLYSVVCWSAREEPGLRYLKDTALPWARLRTLALSRKSTRTRPNSQLSGPGERINAVFFTEIVTFKSSWVKKQMRFGTYKIWSVHRASRECLVGTWV